MRARCDWCGMEVEVMASGRCLLGHPISEPRAEATPDGAEAAVPPSFPAPRDLTPRRRVRKAPPADLPRSIRTAPTPEPAPEPAPERSLRVVPEMPAPSEPAGAADEPLPVIPRISRPWAPVEPDGPSGPVGEEDPWLKRPEPPESEPAQPAPASMLDVPAPTPDPIPDSKSGPASDRGAEPTAPPRPREIEEALREVLTERTERVSTEPAASGAPPGRAPALPAPEDGPSRPVKSRRLRLPFSARAETPVKRPAPEPVRTLKSVPERKSEPKPEPKPEPKLRQRTRAPAPPRKPAAGKKSASPAPMLEAILTGPPPQPAPREPAPAVAEADHSADHGADHSVGIAPGTRNPPSAPVSRRLTAPTPRNTVAWGLAIAATFVAGVAALVLSPSRAEDNRPVVRRIALTSVPGHTVQHDPETESRLRAELGAQRAVPRQLSAATVRNQDGDIVALYQAIVFNDDVAATQRDTDDFIALFAEGAGVSADSFAERPLGDRMIWSGLLDHGQAILLFRGPEVVIVITAETGADGDKLADSILTARGV